MFIVMEIQKSANGQVATLVSTFEKQNEAESKYYDILKYAAISSLPKHGAVILTEDGFAFMNKCYDRTEVETVD